MMTKSMRQSLPLLLAALLASGCDNAAPKDGDVQEKPSAAVPDERLIDEAPAGNGAMADTRSGATSVDPEPVAAASAPGAGTSGPAGAGQATGGADGGRTLGDR